jgi:hypothetical protein
MWRDHERPQTLDHVERFLGFPAIATALSCYAISSRALHQAQ